MQHKKLNKTWLSFLLVFLLFLQAVPFHAMAYGQGLDLEAITSSEADDLEEKQTVTEAVYGKSPIVPFAIAADKTDVFMAANTPFPLKVEQGNPLAIIAPNGTIQGRQQFKLTSENLKLPVNGDAPDPTNISDPENYIQKGDWIELKRGEHFKEVVLPTVNRTLKAKNTMGQELTLGTAYFTPNSIKIVFNGDDYFFGGIGKGITLQFDTTADADVTGINYGETKPISIFGNAYELTNPEIEEDYSITLISPEMIRWDQYSYRGLQPAQFIEGAITWQATVSAFDKFDKTVKLPLDGKTFFTDPSSYNTGFGNVPGIYVEGSFKVNAVSVTPVVGTNGELSYTFPVGTGNDPKVEYKTWIPKEGYYHEYHNPPGNLGRSYRDMLGSVQLKQDDTTLTSAGQEISFAPDWIQAAASYDHSSATITWTVTVNHYNKKGLKDLTVTNVLPTGLELTSATYQTWVDGTTSGEKSITPDANSVYSFGNIDGKVVLTLKTKVNSGSDFTINPRANWKLDTPNNIQDNDVTTGTRPAAVTAEAKVVIGSHTFSKGGSISMDDFNLGSIKWTVNLIPQYALPNAAVYDVLVHGGDLNVLNDAVDATGEVTKEVITKIKASINTANLWKKYHDGTLTGSTGLNYKVIPLTVDGKQVADLIKVTGYNSDQLASFSFRAVITNPDILFRQDINTSKVHWNQAVLLDGDTAKVAQNQASFHVRMLNKEMLFASKPLNADGTPANVAPNNVGNYIRDDNNEAWTLSAYDRITKTVTFRLGVNMPGYKTDEMAKDGGSRVVTDIRLVDTLPEGWEFVPFSEGKDFELYQSYSDNSSGTEYGRRNDARTVIEPSDAAHVVSFTKSDNVGTFTFSKLESPYVILVKARPTNAKLAEYLEEYTTNGTDKQVLYNKADLHMTWGGKEKTVTEQRKVIVPIQQPLTKSVKKPVPGVLEWTINYSPPFNMTQGVHLKDTLGAGMNLRYDVDGKLVLTAPSMVVYPAKLTASGALERDGSALDLTDPNAEVKVTAEPGAGGTTVLTFTMKDPNKFYQFVYQTEIDPSKVTAGQKMGNNVKLEGDDKLKSVSATSESTLDSTDLAGSAGENVFLPLKKVDPDGKPIEGVEFTLYDKDGNIIRTGTTDKDGKLNFIFPNPGYYELKETAIDPETRLPITHIYQVYVGNTPGKPVWIDGTKVDAGNPLVVPTPATGKLTVSNTVKVNGGEPTKDFTYTLTFSGDQLYPYPYTKYDGLGAEVEKGTMPSNGTVTLKHGETVVFNKIIEGVTYIVTQNEYTNDGYTTNPINRAYTDTIIKNGNHKADYVNTRLLLGDLVILNTVAGSGGDLNKFFEFTVSFTGDGATETYFYTKSDGTTGTIKTGDTITLKHNETITIKDLPKGIEFKVTETDYSADGYTTTPFLEQTGTIETGTNEVPFTNTRNLPGALVLKTRPKGDPSAPTDLARVPGDGKTPAELIATLTDKEGNPIENAEITFWDKDGNEIGKTTTDENGIAAIEFTPDKVVDTTTVEYPFTATTTEKTSTGVPYEPSNEVKVIAEPPVGSLQISNTVDGNGGDKTKKFEFTVSFIGDGADGEYSYISPDGTEIGKIRSNGKISLEHNETIVIKDLPSGLTYTVTQTDYSGEGYTTNPEILKHTGTIITDTLAKAVFTNTRILPEAPGKLVLKTRPKGNPNAPTDLSKVPGDGKTPAELIATLLDKDGMPLVGEEITFKDEHGNEIGKAITDNKGISTLEFTPDKVIVATEKEYLITATTTAKTSTGASYEPSNKVTVIATPAQLYGILRDNNTGKVIPNADVTIRNVKTGETVTIKTDENGAYRHPVNRDEEYTITYEKIVNIGGVDTPVPFTQKATTEDSTTVEGKDIPAEITAVGIVLFQQTDGTASVIKDTFAGKLNVYLKDENGNYIEENGKPKAFPLDPTYGTFTADDLSEQIYTMEVRYEFEPGKELAVNTFKLNVKADGELNISEELVDPYGTVYDAAKGSEKNGEVKPNDPNVEHRIEGAVVTLYFANTPRNIANGIVPGTGAGSVAGKVNLPLVPGFDPFDNKSPEQTTGTDGFYAYMVYPETDYYIVVTAPGYKTYTSPTLSVEWDIVKYNVPMVKESSGGSSGGGSSKDTTPSKSVDIAVDLKTNQRSFLEETEVNLNIEYKDKKGNAKNTELIVTIPEGIEVVDAKGGKIVGNTIVWKLGDLKEGEIGSKTLVIKLPKISSSEATLKLKAEITADGELIYLIDDISTLNLSVFSNRFDSKHHKRYIQGYPDGLFKPDRTITRAEIAVAFARILELDDFVKNEQIYNDVQLDAWYARGVEAATRRGLFNGYEGGSFRPDQAITRAELAAVIARFLELSERPPVKGSFKDIDDHWALGYIAELYRNNVVSGYGDNTFKPDAPLKRSEAVTMINRMLNRGPLKGIDPSFPDVGLEHWANGDVEESTRSHDYSRNADSSEAHIKTVYDKLNF